MITINNTTDLRNAKMADLLEYYNHHADKPIKKFSDRKTAERRVTKLIEELRGALTTPRKRPVEAHSNWKDTAVVQKAESSTGSGKRGRKSKYAGVSIYPKVKFNPRKKKTGRGYQAMQIVLNQPGLPFEQYTAMGGRTQDLEWDLAHGNVEVK